MESFSNIVNFFARNFIGQLERPKSSLGYSYPTLRDHPLHTAEVWLRGKQEDDGAEGLWRIYDGLYDFRNFVDKHPGGPDWLELTKGTDITEAFESHHISVKPERLLNEYFVREAEKPRRSPFTFEDDGFYKTLKKRVRKNLDDIPKRPETKSKIIADVLLLLFALTSFFAVRKQSLLVGFLSGIFLTMTSITAHNFFHQRNNFRMYYFALTMMSSRSWRVSHVLSHHIYTNTVYDMEISSFEPFLQYLPAKKSYFVRYATWLYSPIVYSVLFLMHYIITLVQAAIEKKPLRLENYIPLLHVFILYHCSNEHLASVIIYYLYIEIVSSFFFGLIGLNAAHHHPDIFHDGNDPRASPKIDWGLHQMDCVIDKSEVQGSHFLGMVTFGDHALHHLFPTIDHGRLDFLYPVVELVCKEFDVKFRMTSQLNLIWGQFQQLAMVIPQRIKRKH